MLRFELVKISPQQVQFSAEFIGLSHSAFDLISFLSKYLIVFIIYIYIAEGKCNGTRHQKGQV